MVYNNKNPGMYHIRKRRQTELTDRAYNARTNSILLILTKLVKSTYIQRTQRFSITVFTKAVTGSLPPNSCAYYTHRTMQALSKPIISLRSTASMVYVVEMDGFVWGRNSISNKFPSSNGSYLTPVYLYISFIEVSCRQFVSPKRPINSIKSPASGAGNVSEPRLMSQVVYA
jgi:hypothetical protein